MTEGRKLYFKATDMQDQQEWVIALNNKIASISYVKKLASIRILPDPRVLEFFRHPDLETFIFEGKEVGMPQELDHNDWNGSQHVSSLAGR